MKGGIGACWVNNALFFAKIPTKKVPKQIEWRFPARKTFP